jgi:hypothetical protein
LTTPARVTLPLAAIIIIIIIIIINIMIFFFFFFFFFSSNSLHYLISLQRPSRATRNIQAEEVTLSNSFRLASCSKNANRIDPFQTHRITAFVKSEHMDCPALLSVRPAGSE